MSMGRNIIKFSDRNCMSSAVSMGRNIIKFLDRNRMSSGVSKGRNITSFEIELLEFSCVDGKKHQLLR